MKNTIEDVLEKIEKDYQGMIQKGSRHYLEVNIGDRALQMGHTELKDIYGKTCAIVPLKTPQKGMKVRIDGRTFVDYAEFASGIAVPGYLARKTGQSSRDSMICNFT